MMPSAPQPETSAYAELPHASKVLFESELVQVGATRCPAEHPDFAKPGPIQRHALYLGGSPVHVSPWGASDFLANNTTVSFHNRGDLVERSSHSGSGDFSNWIAPHPELILSTLGQLQGTRKFDEQRPFGFRSGPCKPALYLAQKRLVHGLQSATPPEAVEVEERAIELLTGALSAALHSRPKSGSPSPKTARRHAALVGEAKQFMGARYRSRLDLAEIARAAGCSAFHLARVFRAQTGWSLHAYLTQLRLNAALDQLWDGARDLTQLALELGFSSHSHFTSAFKQAFGSPPSQLRQPAPRWRAGS